MSLSSFAKYYYIKITYTISPTTTATFLLNSEVLTSKFQEKSFGYYIHSSNCCCVKHLRSLCEIIHVIGIDQYLGQGYA